MIWVVMLKRGFGAEMFWHQGAKACLAHSLPISSSTFGNSRLRNDKGFCADRPQSQTDSHMSAEVPSGRE